MSTTVDHALLFVGPEENELAVLAASLAELARHKLLLGGTRSQRRQPQLSRDEERVTTGGV